MVIALLAPGQGSQTVGMLSPWLELDGTRARLTTWSEATGLDLVRLGTTATAEEIQDTAITQPLVVALALLAYEQLERRVEIPADAVVTGHSVGELAAAAMAGVLSPRDAVVLAAVRGREMAAACALAPTGMTAVMRGEPDEVVAWLDKHDLVAANRNGAGQIVAAGRIEDIDRAVAEPLDGVKLIKLKVAGAFHTAHMATAQEALRAVAADITPADPARTLLSNADGTAVTSGAEMLSRLVAQVTSPVRWDLCMTTMADLGVETLAELPPAGALTGLAKRELKGKTIVAMKTPEHLDTVVELIGGAA